jgi:predicted RNA binding protein YcfA (HicA-like mRNA interferase family)
MSPIGHGMTSAIGCCAVKVRDIIRTIELDGWTKVRTQGSHRHFAHPTKVGLVTIAGRASDDLPIGTLRHIYRQAGRVSRARESLTDISGAAPGWPGATSENTACI